MVRWRGAATLQLRVQRVRHAIHAARVGALVIGGGAGSCEGLRLGGWEEARVGREVGFKGR